MALTISVSNHPFLPQQGPMFVEDTIFIKIAGGSIPSNAQLLVLASTTTPVTGGGNAYFKGSGLSSNFNIIIPYDETDPYVGTNYGLLYVYAEAPNTSKVYLNFLLMQNGNILSQTTKTMYIKPEPPTFDNIPTWQDINSTSVNFSNNNQMIVHGLSKLKISNINATAHKGATLKTIVYNDENYSYSDAHENGIVSDMSYSVDKNHNPWLYIDVIDSRGLRTRAAIADVSKYKYTYQLPKIKELIVERDGISETTILKAKGYYSEGYQVGINGLNSSYNYKENVAGTSWISGITNLKIKKTISREYEDFLAILDEYNNSHQGLWNTDYSSLVEEGNYYEDNAWEHFGIDDLFVRAISYNDKYTQEYLIADTKIEGRWIKHYCISGGYNGDWKQFWRDTLELIYDKIVENGGNYEFEIVDSLDNPDVAIQGDVQSGFSIDKVFNIQLLIADMMDEVKQITLLPTAIPAIDVYKDNVAIHGLYDETLGGTQINGDLFLNGEGLFEQKILWSGADYMNATQTANLSESVLTQKNGIVLIWSGYSGGAGDYNFVFTYIPKKFLEFGNGYGCFVTIGGSSGIESFKYIYVGNTYIKGHANNNTTITSGGVTYNNRSAVLRYVIGV